MANAERWAATAGNPSYAIDDETALQVADGVIRVISEGTGSILGRVNRAMRSDDACVQARQGRGPQCALRRGRSNVPAPVLLLVHESEIEGSEYQDDADVDHQPLPKTTLKEKNVHGYDDSDHREPVERGIQIYRHDAPVIQESGSFAVIRASMAASGRFPLWTEQHPDAVAACDVRPARYTGNSRLSRLRISFWPRAGRRNDRHLDPR
jgi:hypothetical protein